jgi:hypothetical protein
MLSNFVEQNMETETKKQWQNDASEFYMRLEISAPTPFGAEC